MFHSQDHAVGFSRYVGQSAIPIKYWVLKVTAGIVKSTTIYPHLHDYIASRVTSPGQSNYSSLLNYGVHQMISRSPQKTTWQGRPT